MLGQRINNFEIVRLLGEGGMGSVYEAEHSLIHKKVAVKVLRREFALDPVLVRRFFNEARATNEIRHPNIVEVIDVGATPEGVPYLVLELLEGESLGARLNRLTWLELDTAIDFASQAAGALEAAHAHGIVHRDLKPDNLFLISDQRVPGKELVKVLDFGIAKLRGDLSPHSLSTRAGSILGTPTYMSPEQCRGLPGGVDHRSDVYGLGVIVYEMLCGRPPFVAEGLGDILVLHLTMPPTPLSRYRLNLPGYVEAAVLRALAKDPAQRFQSMAEFRSALAAAEGAVSSVAPRSPPLGPQSPLLAHVDRAAALAHVPTEVDVPGASLSTRPPTPPGSPTPPGTALEHVHDTVPAFDEQPASGRARTLRGVAGVAVLALLLLGGAALVHWRAAVVPAPSLMHAAVGAAATPPELRAAASATADPEVTAVDPPTAAEPALPGKPAHHKHAGGAHVQTTPVTSAIVPAPPVPAPSGVEASAPKAAEDGFLSLDSAPWANVFLGGKLLGVTPLMHVALPPGRHVLTLKNPELGASTSYVVDIKPGAVVSRFVGWEKE